MSNARQHIRVPLTASVVASLIMAAASSGVTWGLYASRLEAAERRADQAENAIAAAITKNAEQDTRIAVITAQYSEILRRLDAIEKKIDQR